MKEGFVNEPALVKKALLRRIRMCKELQERIDELERKLAYTEEVPYGTKIMCTCDEEQCYKAIEYLPGSIVAYEDISTDSILPLGEGGEFIPVMLPANVWLMWHPDPNQKGVILKKTNLSG